MRQRRKVFAGDANKLGNKAFARLSPSIYLSICLSIYLSFYLSIYLCLNSSIYLVIYPSIFKSFGYQFIYIVIYLYMSIYLYIDPSIYQLSIHLDCLSMECVTIFLFQVHATINMYYYTMQDAAGAQFGHFFEGGGRRYL